MLSRQDDVLKRVMGFQGKNNMLRGQFKDFLKINGGIPGMNNVPGNMVPGQIVPGQKGGMLFDIPGGTAPVKNRATVAPGTRTKAGNRTAPAEAVPSTPSPRAPSPFKMFKVPGL